MSRGKKWLWRLFLLGFVALVTMGLWLPPIITHAVEKDYPFPEVEIDATVLPNGDMVLEETRTFDFRTDRSPTRTSTSTTRSTTFGTSRSPRSSTTAPRSP